MWPNCTLKDKARHEAGHAVARIRLGVPFTEVLAANDSFKVVTGRPHPDFLTTNFSTPNSMDDARRVAWSQEARALIESWMVAAASGPVAQMHFEGRGLPVDVDRFYLFGGTDDAALMRAYAMGVAASQGGSDNAVFERTLQILSRVVLEAGRLVEENADWIQRVADALVVRGRLTEAEVQLLAGPTELARGSSV